ncbi:YncE family protein [uncultured Algibacter sp.]|uniref:YncE family protein n=1 Tax=uncultured Algibacter sp. TaxID=298659 RepID=UPI002602A107|nr:DUF5074 domain-containing protein [uncultured Algibacter sp.]
MKINKLISKAFILSVLFLASCSDDDSPQLPKGAYENGILVSGEGSGAGTGSISFISNDLTESENLIYKKVNSVELGIYLQSIAFDNDNAYIIVDNANTIAVVDRYTFEYKNEVVTDLSTPRFMTIVGDKGYVTNWGSTSDETDDFVAVVDLLTFSVEKTISVGNGPERIISRDGKLYVSHKGAFTNNDIISVITLSNDNVEEVTVKDRPDELFFNNSGDLVVLSEGRTLYDTDWNVTGNTLGSISTIDVTSLNVDTELNFADGEHPSLMVIDGSTIYYALGNDIFAMDANATTLPASSVLTAEGYLYGMEVNNNRIYATNASFTDVSTLNIYDLETGSKLDSKSVALGAAKIYFN